jgi:hypothetical protein
MNITEAQRIAIDQIAIEAHRLDEGVRHDLGTDPHDWSKLFDHAADWSRKDGDEAHALLRDGLATRTLAALGLQTWEVLNQTGDAVFAIVRATDEQAAIDAARQDPHVAKRMELAGSFIAMPVTYATTDADKP